MKTKKLPPKHLSFEGLQLIEGELVKELLEGAQIMCMNTTHSPEFANPPYTDLNILIERKNPKREDDDEKEYDEARMFRFAVYSTSQCTGSSKFSLMTQYVDGLRRKEVIRKFWDRD